MLFWVGLGCHYLKSGSKDRGFGCYRERKAFSGNVMICDSDLQLQLFSLAAQWQYSRVVSQSKTSSDKPTARKMSDSKRLEISW